MKVVHTGALGKFEADRGAVSGAWWESVAHASHRITMGEGDSLPSIPICHAIIPWAAFPSRPSRGLS